MNNKKILPIFLIILIAIFGGVNIYKKNNKVQATDVQTAAVENLSSQILADGMVGSEDEVNLHFQTGGKLTYLPLKEGDKVNKGQVIAKLDTYTLEKQLGQALNNYQATRDNFDQAQENSTNKVMQGQQKFTLDTQNKVQMSGEDKDNLAGDIVKRLLDQQQLSLNNSVANVELTSYAIQLSSLVSPIAGTVIHQDATNIGINISSSNSFVVANTAKLIFKANVGEDYIQFISIGDQATIKLMGDNTELSGTVEKIYPEKIKLANGHNIYKVDVKSDKLINVKYGQTGSVTINQTNKQDVLAIPVWTVQNNKYVWVGNNDKYEKIEITVGRTFGNKVEVTSGLNASDKVIANPENIIKAEYKFY